MTRPKSKSERSLGIIRLDKELVPFFEEGNPETEPLFVNHFQVSHHGADIFIDVGVISVDDILNPQARGRARFLVAERLAMSIPSLIGLQQQIDAVVSNMEAMGINVQQIQA